MKYKIGDRVRIKSLDWYNKHTNGTEVDCGEYPFTTDMKEFCAQERIIAKVFQECYFLLGIGNKFAFTDEMIEGLVEEEVGLVDKLSSRWVNEFNLPDGYIFKDENGNVINAQKIVLEKKKKEYPKTYEEYCRVLGMDSTINHTIGTHFRYRYIIKHFIKLLICRDAYWKIAGEEMGLDKSWEPDWNNISDKYCIYFVSGDVWSKECQTRQCPFAFPTKEMRNAFKENFDKDLESYKELL